MERIPLIAARYYRCLHSKQALLREGMLAGTQRSYCADVSDVSDVSDGRRRSGARPPLRSPEALADHAEQVRKPDPLRADVHEPVERDAAAAAARLIRP